MPDQVTAAPSSVAEADTVLTSDALAFVADLQRRFGARRDELPAARRARYTEIARTGRLDFLEATAPVRVAEIWLADLDQEEQTLGIAHGTIRAIDRIVGQLGDADGRYAQARVLFERFALDEVFADFLTVAAYDLID